MAFSLSYKRLIDSGQSKRLVGMVGCSLILLLMGVPWQPRMPEFGLDPSWTLVLEWGFLQGKAFGSELVFTFGPLGFLATYIYHPDLYIYQLAFWCTLALLFGLFFGRYWGRVSWKISVLFLLVFLCVASFHSLIPDAWLFMLPLMSAILFIDSSKSGTSWLAYAILGLSIVATLIKFSVLLAAVAVFVLADGVRWLQMRSFPHLSISILVGSWALFLIVTGEWNWPLYIRHGLEVTAGYSAAMQAAGPSIEVVLSIAIASLLALVLIATPAGHEGRAEWFTRVGVVSATALVMFLTFKAGVVRHDGHILITAVGLVLMALTATCRAIEQGAARRTQGLGLVVILLATFQLVTVPARHWGQQSSDTLKQALIYRPKSAIRDAFSVLSQPAVASLTERREEALAGIRAETDLPKVDGSVDVLSWDQAAVLAHHLRFSPRPVFQSYSAYTPRLLNLNYRYLAGDEAPDYLLFSLQTIDGRLPSLEDGMSWPLIWGRYDAVSALDRHLVFRRREHSDRPMIWGEPREHNVGWGESVTITSDGPEYPCVWGEVEIGATMLGRLATIFYKAPVVEIGLRLENETETRRRFIPGMGLTGFLISPFVAVTEEFDSVCSAEPLREARAVKAVSFHVDEKAHRLFRDSIQLRMRPLRINGEAQHLADPTY